MFRGDREGLEFMFIDERLLIEVEFILIWVKVEFFMDGLFILGFVKWVRVFKIYGFFKWFFLLFLFYFDFVICFVLLLFIFVIFFSFLLFLILFEVEKGKIEDRESVSGERLEVVSVFKVVLE